VGFEDVTWGGKSLLDYFRVVFPPGDVVDARVALNPPQLDRLVAACGNWHGPPPTLPPRVPSGAARIGGATHRLDLSSLPSSYRLFQKQPAEYITASR